MERRYTLLKMDFILPEVIIKSFQTQEAPKNLAKHLRISEEKANEICLQMTENPDRKVFIQFVFKFRKME